MDSPSLAARVLAGLALVLASIEGYAQTPIGPFTGMSSESFEANSQQGTAAGACLIRQYVSGAASVCGGELYIGGIGGPSHSGQGNLSAFMIAPASVAETTINFVAPVVRLGAYLRCSGTCQVYLFSASNAQVGSWYVPSGTAWTWYGLAFSPTNAVTRIEIVAFTAGNLPPYCVLECDDLEADFAAGTYAAHPDVDADGFGDANTTVILPVPFPAGVRFDAMDCADLDATVNPNVVEVLCNGKDDNCDGLVDDITTYCVAKVNSQGCTPSISFTGYPSFAGSDAFFITANGVLNNKPGLMIWSLTAASTPFFGGTLCLAAPITRTPGQNSYGSPLPAQDCTGTYAFHFSQAYMLAQLLPQGTHVRAQYWSRDPGSGPPHSASNVGLTNGLSFVICP
jgi:hypothetical protein